MPGGPRSGGRHGRVCRIDDEFGRAWHAPGRGTRIPVSVIVGSIADGDTVDVLLKAYPSLTPEDIQAALKYAAEAVREGHLLPLVK